jgi:hypothetical protein
MRNSGSNSVLRVRESGEARCIPKLCGADMELGNSILGLEVAKGSGALASQLLLREIDGLPLPPKHQSAGTVLCEALSHGQGSTQFSTATASPNQSGSGYNPQDRDRKFLQANGGCAYIDLDHLELCLPEVLSARDHVAASHAMLRMAREAQQSVNAKLREGLKIVVLANNSDGQGNSYGSHVDFLITRRAWDNLFARRLHNLLFLATYQTSSIVFTGQGKVGSENRTPPVPYQISQRADYCETLTGLQTTVNRPIVNSRDEPLCGSRRDAREQPATADMARLHVIFYDNTLCHVASLLKVGVMQIVLAMIEAERIKPGLALEDPLDALLRWSHDPTLHARARLTSGRQITAVELQLLFLEEAEQFVARGGCEGIVPDAQFILGLWADTLGKLRTRDYTALAPRLDWVLKLQILQRARQQRPDLDWDSPQLKHLDHMYSSLEDGLYWAYERGSLLETLVTDVEIDRFQHEPPDNTRAWTRARLLRLARPEQVESVDWDSITFSLTSKNYWPRQRTISLANPLGFGKAACVSLFETSTTLDEALDLLGAPSTDPSAGNSTSQGWLYQNATPATTLPGNSQDPAAPNATLMRPGALTLDQTKKQKKGDNDESTRTN